MKKIIFLQFSLVFLLACGLTSSPISTVSMSDTPPPVETQIPTPTVASAAIYENTKYGYSLTYPTSWPLAVQSDEYVMLGEKVVITVWTLDPLSPLGDGPIYESVTDVQAGAYPARLAVGYIGAIGGYQPQRVRTFIFQHNDAYVMFTLHALGFVAPDDLSLIAPIAIEDERIFDVMVASVRFK